MLEAKFRLPSRPYRSQYDLSNSDKSSKISSIAAVQSPVSVWRTNFTDGYHKQVPRVAVHGQSATFGNRAKVGTTRPAAKWTMILATDTTRSKPAICAAASSIEVIGSMVGSTNTVPTSVRSWLMSPYCRLIHQYLVCCTCRLRSARHSSWPCHRDLRRCAMRCRPVVGRRR